VTFLRVNADNTATLLSASDQRTALGVGAGDSPVFATVKLSGLADGYIPYHVSDAAGLANGPLVTDGTTVSFGGKAIVGDVGRMIGAGGIVIYGGAIVNAPVAASLVLDQQTGGVARIMASGASTWDAILALNPYGGAVLVGATAAEGGGALLQVGVRDSTAKGMIALGWQRNTFLPSTTDDGYAHIFVSDATAGGDFGGEAGHLIIQPRVHASVYRDIIFASGLTTPTALMTIKGEGVVLINATAAVGSEKLRVNGTIYVDGTSITTPAESWIGPSSTAGVYFKGGNYGFGTTTPGAGVDFATKKGAIAYNPAAYQGSYDDIRLRVPAGANYFSQIHFVSDGGMGNNVFGVTQSTGTTDGQLDFFWKTFNGGAHGERMRLTYTGSVLIGATAAAKTEKLNVTASGAGSAGIYISSQVPTTTDYTLYNNAGTLTWNGVALDTGGGSLSGTSGTIAKFTGASTVGDSIITESGAEVTIANQVNATTGHLTTLLADHIGEHTGSHTVVFDNTITLPATVAMSAATTISGAYNIDLSGYNVTYVAPGTNTLSAAVAAMSDGDCILLGAGEYIEDSVNGVVIPNDVFNFSIIGCGSPVTIITYRTNDVDGISSVMTDDAYRLQKAYLHGFTMHYDVDVESEKSGIKLWGNEPDTGYITPSIHLDEIRIIRGDTHGHCWGKAVDIFDCHYVTVNRVNVRGPNVVNSPTDGIVLESCMGATVSECSLVRVKNAVYLTKAPNSYIGGVYKHGTEGSTVRDTFAYKCTVGVNIGTKGFANKLFNVGVARPETYGVAETFFTYSITNTSGNGTNATFFVANHDLITGDPVIVSGTTSYNGSYTVVSSTATTVVVASAVTAAGETGTISSTGFRGYNIVDHVYVDIDSAFTGTHLIYVSAPGTAVKNSYVCGQNADNGAMQNINGITLDGVGGQAWHSYVYGNFFRQMGGTAGAGGAAIYCLSTHSRVSDNIFVGSTGNGWDILLTATADHSVVTGNMYSDKITDQSSGSDVSHNMQG
jgi:hypothetical protein